MENCRYIVDSCNQRKGRFVQGHLPRVIVITGAMCVMAPLCNAAVEPFVEGFGGTGPFDGFDNPGWSVSGDGDFAGGGWAVTNYGFDGPIQNPGESDRLARNQFIGSGSFVNRFEMRDVFLAELDMFSTTSSVGRISVLERFGERLAGAVSVGVVEDSQFPLGQWWFSASVSTEEFVGQLVPSGENIAFEIRYDAVAHEVSLLYDNDIEDSDEGITLGPFPFLGDYQETHAVLITVGAYEQGRANGIIDLWSTTPISNVQGDFNGNEVLDAADIDTLSAQVRAGTNDRFYDLNADTLVNDLDRQIWIHDLKQTFFGDADLNRAFDSTDLVQVLASGEYEDTIELNSTWLTGDWNGDGDFTSGDLVVALAEGGYEAGVAAVPEPAGILLAMTIAAFVVIRRRCCPKTRRA